MPLYPGSADLPLNLVGVIGGLLAVGYTLLDAWIKEGEQAPAAEAPVPPPVE